MSKELTPMPVLSPGDSLEAYVQAVNGIPVLTSERERELAEQLFGDGDVDAARQLVMAHLRFVVYVAKGYSGYGLSEADLVQEGNVGLMKAVRRFNPEFGVRLVSFAVHWIKAEIHEFILKNWRIVKIATTKPQRKLFFNLRSAKKRLGWMNDTEVRDVAEQLGVAPEDVRQMETRLSAHDEAFELDSDEDDGFTPSHYLTDKTLDPAVITEKESFAGAQRRKLANGFNDLDARSREIVQRRWLTDSKTTLQELADQFGISAERVRQLEQNALKKLKLSFS
ncbi:MAG: RNA polymerase sigma factor RpoH [Gammaproteobacteria bacterium]|nr:RNA polymerase sigma factor RpoH [Gammaproteobacteria bacterium]